MSKHLRMQGWDFTSPGWYFITICTKNMRSEFGTVVNGRMILNESGRIAYTSSGAKYRHISRAASWTSMS